MTEKHSRQKTIPLTWSYWDAEPKVPELWGKGGSVNIRKLSCNQWNTNWRQWLGECPVDGRINPILKNIHLSNHAFKQHLLQNKLYIQISPKMCHIVYYYKFKASWYSVLLLVRCCSHGSTSTEDRPEISNDVQRAAMRDNKQVIYKKSSFVSGSAVCFML